MYFAATNSAVAQAKLGNGKKSSCWFAIWQKVGGPCSRRSRAASKTCVHMRMYESMANIYTSTRWRKHYPHISKPKRNTIRAAVRLRPTAEASTNGEQSRAAWESREIDVTANALWPSAPPRPDETMRRLGREPDDT